MDPQIQARFNDAILSELAGRFSPVHDRIHTLPAYESLMFAFQRDGDEYILRISHSLRRSPNMIRGEVEWIKHLAAGGAGVARAIPSNRGNLVEAADDGHGDQFLATAFVRAPGRPPSRADWSPARFAAYGETLGRIHRLTISYQPSNPAWKRPTWDDAEFNFVESFLPPEQEIIRQRYHSLRQYLHTLPQDNRVYGLIHQDAHSGNFFIDESERITLFDFDDCLYSWFANDIAIALFYMIINEPHPAALANEFLANFLRGYRRQYVFDESWMQTLPLFLKLREIDLYAVLHRDFDVNNPGDAWVAQFLQGRRQRIEADLPVIDDWKP